MGWLIFGLVIWGIVSVLKRMKGKDPARPQSQGGQRPPPVSSMNRQEQAQRVREEIQRKIRERMGQAQQTPPSLVPPTLHVPTNSVPTSVPRKAKPTTQRPPPLDDTLDRQRQLAERIRELETRRAQQAENAAKSGSIGVRGAVAAGQVSARFVRSDLRNAQSVRRAIVLREVLGKPVGLP